ncbi:ring-hydroxylating oxygenase subunit alpha [Siminovitchia terrae]|uniref:Ring-hydroxylating oxygenase subunit alpha n=1 Tax=Siminovitchia terrae TaxID=1914933 RepID=A0ABQ4L343_SIMTE|nr:aromatic ring-hydroxylating dioxygenase subunit alpha [Siminovitchia terrae]GIN98701.1 ring-hydroxylating oxygenase subunit alpha [Siminovitchia terrae]
MGQTETGHSLEFTLPYNRYVDSDVFAEEKEKIFHNSWILAGHTSQVKNVGDFFTFDIADQPLIISRDKNNEINAFYNICPHRGSKVEKSVSGNKRVFMCQYHGWTFQLDGKLNKAPNFPTNELGKHSCMTKVSLEVYKGMIFINLNPKAEPMAESYGELMESLEKYTFLDSLKKIRVKERVIDANWKAVVDNYLECDHCKIAHPEFSKTFDMKNYHIDLHDNFSCQYSKMTKKADEEQEEHANFYWVWPNLMISIYPGENGNMTTSQILPLAPDKSLAIYSYYFKDDHITEEQEELIRFVDQVREEDFGLVEFLQNGFNTKAFNRGVYSPKEYAIKYFHKRYLEEIQDV